MDYIRFSVRDAQGDDAKFTVPYDADMDTIIGIFRSILFWLTWATDTINKNIPEPGREWCYLDERHDEIGKGVDDANDHPL